MDPSSHPTASAGTARFITRCLLVASHEEQYAGLFPAESRHLYAPLLREAGDRGFVRAGRLRVFRAAFQALVRLTLPGITAHYLARKRCLEDFLRRACGPDEPPGTRCRQVVVLGAGLDTLSWRWHGRLLDVRFIEVDRPAALRVKEAALTVHGEHGPNLTFLPGDLGPETLADILGRCAAFDPGLPTFFLAEGLLMYLAPGQVRSLWHELAAFGGGQVAHAFAFTFMEARSDGAIRFRRSNPLVNWWLRRQGEPFRWSYPPESLGALLAGTGWHLRELMSGDTLRARYLDPAGWRDLPAAVGEWVAFAQTEEAQ